MADCGKALMGKSREEKSEKRGEKIKLNKTETLRLASCHLTRFSAS